MRRKQGGSMSRLGIPDSARRFLASCGFESLYPPQTAAVGAGLLEGRSLLVSAPTASGKTLIAMLALISYLARGGRRRAVYLSPLRALAAEKYSEFAALSDMPVEGGAEWSGRTERIRTARMTGGGMGQRGRPGTVSVRGAGRAVAADIVVATNESMDSAMRRNLGWTDEIDLVIVDEIHLIGDETRGPTLEMVLAQLKSRSDDMQIVGLSATIPNGEEIAEWLGCRLVSSDWRPVPLAEGVCNEEGDVKMNDGRKFSVGKGSEGLPARLGADSVAEGGQCLIFAGTRPSSRSTAVKASKRVESLLSDDEKRRLEEIARKILPAGGDLSRRVAGGRRGVAATPNAAGNTTTTTTTAATATTPTTGGGEAGKAAGQPGGRPQQQQQQQATDLEMDLAALVRKGVAFHHAGLSERLRGIIEDGFRGGSIKVLASTPTLAAGVNLPARRVVVSSVNRYDARYGGNMPIGVLEYKQLCGRAGRPQYDKRGEAVISAAGDPRELFDRYVDGEQEWLESGIMEGKAMRTHLLTVIVLNPGIRKDGMLSFFRQTLGGIQSDEYEISSVVNHALHFLTSEEMVTSKGGRYAATLLGKKTSSLYVDPFTAAYLHRTARDAPQGGSGRRKRTHALGFLHAITCCDEFVPKQNLLKNHHHLADDLLSGPHRRELLTEVYPEECSRSLLVLHEWIMERSDKEIETALKTQAGDLHRMVESATWLAYALYDLARHAGREDLLPEIAALQARIKSGIREELVELVGLRGVGRVRARALYNAGIRSLDDIRMVPLSRLSAIRQIGPTVAASIMRAVGAAGDAGRGAVPGSGSRQRRGTAVRRRRQ